MTTAEYRRMLIENAHLFLRVAAIDRRYGGGSRARTAWLLGTAARMRHYAQRAR